MAGEHISSHLQTLRIEKDQVRRLWLHQANLSMNKLIAKKVLGKEANADMAPVILDSYANTSSAGSVIAMHLHKSDLADGDLAVLCSFGAGYSIGSIAMRHHKK